MGNHTAEQAHQRRVNLLGKELGSLFSHIENDLYNLRNKWRVYRAFFSTNKQRVDLLNQASGMTAFLIEKSLFEAAILSLCRLTDPPEGGPKRSLKNTSVSRLPTLLTHHPRISELEDLIETAKTETEFARSWRNKSIAHSDYDVREGRAKLDTASVAKVDRAIDCVAEIIRWIGINCMDTTIITHPIQEYSNDEVQFLQRIFLGVKENQRLREESKEAAKSGDYEKSRQLLRNYPDWVTHRPPDVLDA